jgi:hypothetical protein
VEAFIEELVDIRIHCHLKHMGISVQNFKAERSFSDPLSDSFLQGVRGHSSTASQNLVVPLVRKAMM